MLIRLHRNKKPHLVNTDHIAEVMADPSDSATAEDSRRAIIYFVEGRNPAGDILPVDETLAQVQAKANPG